MLVVVLVGVSRGGGGRGVGVRGMVGWWYGAGLVGRVWCWGGL